MKIVIAPDSFKESLTASEVCDAIETGFTTVFKEADIIKIPMADGGEGTAAALKETLSGEWQSIIAHDPLMRPIEASYVLLPNQTAIIEMASCAGLHLLTQSERDPGITTTYGVGEMLLDAIDKGAKHIILGIGGSATNDAGTGMLKALGYRFMDAQHHELAQGGKALAALAFIDSSGVNDKIADISITVACDVTNPLCGKLGASHVYAPQKGAALDDIVILDNALNHFANIASRQNFPDNRNEAGAGAAGGLGFALMTFLSATLTGGFQLVSEFSNLEQMIQQADLVITGEGKMDFQTSMGKVASGVLSLAKAVNVPVIAICGVVDDLHSHWKDDGFTIALPSIQTLGSLDEALALAKQNVEKTAYNIAMAMQLGQQLNR
ncbi:glycerate kinase [Moraxella osloensis]|nr:glycerate kinase [Moraxella osloensis]MBW4018100.1 glycerate kinase [Moraxella osloensis]